MNILNGILNASGQEYILDAILTKINTGLYVGLTTNASGNITDQVNSGITELSPSTCSGYQRILSSGWAKFGNVPDQYIKGSGVTFTPVSGNWENIKGYFVSVSSTENDSLWYQYFPRATQGTLTQGNPLSISPEYGCLYYE